MESAEKQDEFAGEPPSVRDLARRLKDRIQAYKGGMEGVWKQIDERFKQEKGKPITGLKGVRENKITHSAFKKAFQRLDSAEDSGRLEQMRFQINGNPLLLMNIFEILGITGYSDLLKLDFKKPDIADEIAYIGSYLKKIRSSLTDINERMEAGHKSIKTFKLNADFEEITNRLYFVLLENKDPLLKNPLYLMGKNNLSEKDNYKLLETHLSGDKEKARKEYNEYQKKIEGVRYFHILKWGFLYNLKEERQRVVLTAMMFYDYLGYSFNNPVLKEYRRRLNVLEPESASFETDFAYILSPLFTILLYLRITILFITRLDETSLFVDSAREKDTIKIIGTNTIKTHLLNKLKQLFKEIQAILNAFIKNEIKDTPQEKYTEYKDIAVQIITLLKTIFIDNKSVKFEQAVKEAKKYKTIPALLNAKNRTYSGNYIISYNELERLGLVVLNVLEIRRATERDLND